MRDVPPVHPGEILFEEFLKPMGISRYQLAKDISVPAMRIRKICNSRSGISADTALRLAHYFGTAVEYWTGIQTHYGTECAKRIDIPPFWGPHRVEKTTLFRIPIEPSNDNDSPA